MIKVLIFTIIVSVAVLFFFRVIGNKKVAVQNIQIGVDFLTANKSKEGVKETESGLQYLVLQEGTGTEHPKANDKVKVHYHGTMVDGKVFDSSVDRGEPIEFGLNQVIKGWTEGVQLMVVGEKTRFFIPAYLAYGNRSAGSIKPGSALIFDVELVGINE